MAHKVYFYDRENPSQDRIIKPALTVETENAQEAVKLARETLDATRDPFAVAVKADWRLCATIEEFVALENTSATWLEENPIEGCWIGRLMSETEHWKDFGVETPEQLEKYLLLEVLSDLYKDEHGIRPRGALSMESSIDEISAALQSLGNTLSDRGPEFEI